MRTNSILVEAGQNDKQFWKDLWAYRELFYFMAWRDILVRYKQTVIGIVWAVLRPLLTMIVLTVVFGKWAKMPSEGIPYPILVLTALLPWQLFSNSFTGASNSLILNPNLISKVYFPRVILPTTSVVVGLVDFLISFAILICLMLWYHFCPSWRLFFLPLPIFIAVALSLGTGMWISALNVRYRDFRYVIPFIVQFGLYISPVGFSSSVVPDKWRLLYSLNPMVGVIDGFRYAVLGNNTHIYIPGFSLSFILVVVLFVTGFRYFRNTERTFADLI